MSDGIFESQDLIIDPGEGARIPRRVGASVIIGEAFSGSTQTQLSMSKEPKRKGHPMFRCGRSFRTPCGSEKWLSKFDQVCTKQAVAHIQLW